MPTLDELPRVEVGSASELRSWLFDNADRDDGVWLVTSKKHVPDRYVSTSEVLDELLCFGWVDGVRRALDDDRTMQLISPRRTRVWARSYKERADRLIASGRMRPEGMASIEASKRSGSWDLMDDVDALIVPSDLRAALDGSPMAGEWFDAAAPSYRRNLLRWVALAKTQPTRARRIDRIVETAGRGERIRNM